MEENRLDNEEVEDDADGMILSEDDILQVIELGDDQPMNGQMEEVDDDDDDVDDDINFDNQNAMDDPDLVDSSGVDQVNTRDDSVGCFRSHTGPVFSVRLSPDGILAVTGGEDDKAFVWKMADCSTMFVCNGHKDSVTSTGFSHDGKYVVTADMSGLVQVWKVASGESVWRYECSADLEWLLWHSNSSVLLAGTSDGLGWMWKIPTNDCKCFQGPGVRNICGTILPDGRRACHGYENGHITLWDLKTSTVAYEVKVHSSALTSVSAHQDNNLLLTGSEDCTSQLVSSHSKKVLCKFVPGPVGDKHTIETVGFCPSMPLAATGSLNGTLAVWDIPSQKLRHSCIHPDGVVKIHWCHSASLLYTACLDGIVRLWDSRNGSSVRTWEGHTDHLLDLDVTRDDSTIVTACEDCTARIFSHH